MLTDVPPRNQHFAAFRKSDAVTDLALPDHQRLPEFARAIEAAMKIGKTAEVRFACAEFLAEASKLYKVPPCGVRVALYGIAFLAHVPIICSALWALRYRRVGFCIEPRGSMFPEEKPMVRVKDARRVIAAAEKKAREIGQSVNGRRGRRRRQPGGACAHGWSLAGQHRNLHQQGTRHLTASTVLSLREF
jgi:hypothetical protein